MLREHKNVEKDLNNSRTFLLNKRFSEQLMAKPTRSWVESYLAMRAHRMLIDKQAKLNPHLELPKSGIIHKQEHNVASVENSLESADFSVTKIKTMGFTSNDPTGDHVISVQDLHA